jgi:Uncharacterized conserved protein (DUF2075)
MGCVVAPEESQFVAWQSEYNLLTRCFSVLGTGRPSAKTWTIIFEYELPRERGRRPDVIILAGEAVLVLEFKEFAAPLQSHLDQVRAYCRDILYYHSESHSRQVLPVLVLTKYAGISLVQDNVEVASPISLQDTLNRLISTDLEEPFDSHRWLRGDYDPLPSLITAARLIFAHEPLPQIKRAHSAGIPSALRELHAIADSAEQNCERHLALITGVPGAGKTLVGLQFVYSKHGAEQNCGKKAVFLSGNGPLVKVLQHVLKSSVFVQDVHGFLKQYGGEKSARPLEHIWVYDEAQRAWDSERVKGMRGHSASEPEDFLRIGERMPSWAMMVGLIGQGQEIHLGEEAGLEQWNDAIAAMDGPWTVHCPDTVTHVFDSAALVLQNNNLNLTASLRSHLAEDVQNWVMQLLNGNIDEAANLAGKANSQGFNMYATRSLDSAKDYVRQRYRVADGKRYGLLASSKARNLAAHGVQNGFTFTRRLREGRWFNDGPESPLSCCALHDVATEFQCQGLELDFPIVCWGDDLLWSGAAWVSRASTRSAARDPHRLRLNSYRVLLSRGRDGFFVFVPDSEDMDATFSILCSAGLRDLGTSKTPISEAAASAEGASNSYGYGT